MGREVVAEHVHRRVDRGDLGRGEVAVVPDRLVGDGQIEVGLEVVVLPDGVERVRDRGDDREREEEGLGPDQGRNPATRPYGAWRRGAGGADTARFHRRQRTLAA